jgi:hypothetical protein
MRSVKSRLFLTATDETRHDQSRTPIPHQSRIDITHDPILIRRGRQTARAHECLHLSVDVFRSPGIKPGRENITCSGDQLLEHSRGDKISPS